MALEVVTRLANPAHDPATKPTGAKGARPAKSTFVYGSFANALRSALAGVGLTRLRTALTSVADKAGLILATRTTRKGSTAGELALGVPQGDAAPASTQVRPSPQLLEVRPTPAPRSLAQPHPPEVRPSPFVIISRVVRRIIAGGRLTTLVNRLSQALPDIPKGAPSSSAWDRWVLIYRAIPPSLRPRCSDIVTSVLDQLQADNAFLGLLAMGRTATKQQKFRALLRIGRGLVGAHIPPTQTPNWQDWTSVCHLAAAKGLTASLADMGDRLLGHPNSTTSPPTPLAGPRGREEGREGGREGGDPPTPQQSSGANGSSGPSTAAAGVEGGGGGVGGGKPLVRAAADSSGATERGQRGDGRTDAHTTSYRDAARRGANTPAPQPALTPARPARARGGGSRGRDDGRGRGGGGGGGGEDGRRSSATGATAKPHRTPSGANGSSGPSTAAVTVGGGRDDGGGGGTVGSGGPNAVEQLGGEEAGTAAAERRRWRQWRRRQRRRRAAAAGTTDNHHQRSAAERRRRQWRRRRRRRQLQ